MLCFGGRTSELGALSSELRVGDPPTKHPKSCGHSLAHARASIARCSSPGHSGFVGLQALGSEMQVGEPRPLCTHGTPTIATLAHACARTLTRKSRQVGTHNESKQRLHTGPSPFAHPPNLTSSHPPPSLHAPPTLTHSPPPLHTTPTALLAHPSHLCTPPLPFAHSLPPLHAYSSPPPCTLPPTPYTHLCPPLHTSHNFAHLPHLCTPPISLHTSHIFAHLP